MRLEEATPQRRNQACNVAATKSCIHRRQLLCDTKLRDAQPGWDCGAATLPLKQQQQASAYCSCTRAWLKPSSCSRADEERSVAGACSSRGAAYAAPAKPRLRLAGGVAKPRCKAVWREAGHAGCSCPLCSSARYTLHSRQRFNQLTSGAEPAGNKLPAIHAFQACIPHLHPVLQKGGLSDRPHVVVLQTAKATEPRVTAAAQHRSGEGGRGSCMQQHKGCWCMSAGEACKGGVRGRVSSASRRLTRSSLREAPKKAKGADAA